MATTVSDHDLIRNTIADVAIAFDTKAFSRLVDFFTQKTAQSTMPTPLVS